MTTQEAYTREIKPKPTDNDQNERTILVFPNMSSSLFALFTGDSKVIDTFATHNPEFEILKREYKQAVINLSTDEKCPVTVSMTQNGLIFSLVLINNDVREEHSYYEYTFSEDKVLINAIADALNDLVTSAIRTIPKLLRNDIQCRNVSQVKENPLYEYILFTYSLFSRLGRTDSLLKCYLQLILLTKNVTYVSMFQNIAYITNLSETLSAYYNDGQFLQVVPSIKFNDETKKYEEIDGATDYVAVIANYTGQKRKTRLFIRSAPKREMADNARFMSIGVAEELV